MEDHFPIKTLRIKFYNISMQQGFNSAQETKIRKAVFPVAGFGTRFLPITKSMQKEMLPVIDMPLIQYAANEAIAAGITSLIFVTTGPKCSIQNYFDVDPVLESILIKDGKQELLEITRNILPKGISCFYTRQEAHLGLGDAVLCAKDLVGDDLFFAVLLADDLIDNDNKPCMQQMVDAFTKKNSAIVAVQKINHADTNKYGIVDIAQGEQRILKIRGITEKPEPEEAPSDFGVVGRYILPSSIFPILENTEKGSGSEIQLTDAIDQLISQQPVYALQFEGKRYDCGNKIGYLEGCIAFALKHPEFSAELKDWLQEFLGRSG